MIEATETFGPSLGGGLFVVGLCLVASAFFSATETSLTSLSSLKTKHLKEKSRGARVLGLWLDSPHRVLASILILNNLVIVFASLYLGQLFLRHFGVSSLWVITAAMTLLIVVFAEVIPKTLARSYAEKSAVPLMYLFQGFYWLVYPLTWVASELRSKLSRLVGSRDGDKSAPQITEEELEFLLNIGEEEGVIEEQKHDMLSGIFEMGETIVREIMVPRPDIITLSHKTKITDAVKMFEDTGHSRIPIYDGKVDNVIGVVHAKDVLYFLRRQQKQADPDWEGAVSELKREAMFTLETKSVDELFQDMRKARQQIAIVIDEHGGTSGVVTMEDIFEEIVGEIRDEYDNEEDVIRPTKDNGVYVVDCKIHVDDFCDFFEFNPDDIELKTQSEDYDTLGGLIIHHFGQVPRIGEKLYVGTLEVEVTELSRRRVRRVLVRVPQGSPQADGQGADVAGATSSESPRA
jgi:CBS domain containing-hemolysin-like protein